MMTTEKEEGSGVGATADKIQRKNNIPKNASESDVTYATNFETQQQNALPGGSLARRENAAGSSEPSSKPNKPSLLNPNKNNNTNKDNNIINKEWKLIGMQKTKTKQTNRN